MTQRLSQDERINRADEFRRVWEENGFDEWLQELRQDYIDQWASSLPHETKMRDDLWRGVHIVDQFKQHLISKISDGAAAKIEQRRKSK